MIQTATDLADTWIETPTDNGKCYYYNAKTRETTWNKPDNANAKILTQEQFQNAFVNNQQRNNIQQQNNSNDKDSTTAKPGQQSTPTTNATTVTTIPSVLPQFPQIGIPHQLIAGAPNPRFPPPFVPPIHPAGFPFGAPLASPWLNQASLLPQATTSGVDQLKQQLVLKIDTELRLQAAEWQEFKTPDGKCYYHNTKTQKSVWEKPEILIRFEKALEEVKKNEANAKQNSNIENNKSEVRSSPESDEQQSTKNKQQETKKEEVKDKSKPISSTPIPGTPWCVVWTGDNRVFFYNPSSKTSLWDCPAELKNRPEVAELTKCPPKDKDGQQQDNNGNIKNNQNSKRSHEQQEQNGYPDSKKLKNDKNSKDKEKDEKRNDNKNEAEILAAKQREMLPIEERLQMFKTMLLEKKVSPFSTWEKELHKIVFDQRYLLLASQERKEVFEQFIKERSEEERKEKRQQQKLYRVQFRQLLEQANLSSRATYSEFSQKHGKDSRFRNIDKSRNRESIFNEFITELKRKEREEKEKQRDKAKANFLELLKEQDCNADSSWPEVKEKIHDDPRYKAIESSSTKETIFKEFVSRLNKNISIVDKEISESLREKEKQERIEASLREREKEVHRELAAHFRERDKERENHLHAENVESFNALLIDLIRNPNIDWREAKRLLKKDHRWDLVEMLSRGEMEQLFERHIDNLIKKKREKFRAMLDEIKNLNLSSSWKEVRRLIKNDSRYLKFSNSDRKCEREFTDYIKERLQMARNEFRELLQETKLITYKSKQMSEESEQHLQDIINVLQNDKRYLILENFADDRREILINYISELHNMGTSKPITVNDPPSSTSRRK